MIQLASGAATTTTATTMTARDASSPPVSSSITSSRWAGFHHSWEALEPIERRKSSQSELEAG